MATKPNTNSTLDINEDDVDAVPEEHIVNNTDNTAALSIDALNDLTPANRQRDELERQKLTPPIGDWIKDTRWTMNAPIVYSGDSEQGDINPAGRTMLSFSGKCQTRTVNSIEYDPQFYLRISPDKRMSKNNEKVVDMPYKMWLKVEDLYLSLNGAKWTTGKQLFSMLMEDTFVIRTMAGDNNPIVDIKPQQRKR